jgi:hydroxymethylpyrimidine/phosphomethylpyrimidine kinase
LRVAGVHPIPTEFVADQLDAVLSDYGAAAVKSGFLGRVDLIQTIAAKLGAYQIANIVIDPVLVNHRGEAMFTPDVTQAYVDHLLPLADLVTPNRWEAALIAGGSVTTTANMEAAAARILSFGVKNVLIKGGREGDEMIDLFYDGRSFIRFHSPHVNTKNTHGSGDTLSAAICALLAKGEQMETAVQRAHQFIAQAIHKAKEWQLGAGHGPVAQW